MRKAYSPIRLEGDAKPCGDVLCLSIENRFNHTNLQEVDVTWRCGGKGGSMKGPDLDPGEKGSLLIPVPYKKGDTLTLAFTDPFGNRVEDACRPLGIPVPGLPACCAGAPSLREGENGLILEGDGFRLHFSTETGLITAGYAEKELVLTGGPYLHLTGLALAPWEPESFRWETRQDCAAVAIAGSYGKVRVRFDLRIDRAGYMETLYEVSDMPYASPRRLAMRVGDDTDSGGYEEVGIRFLVPGEMDTLSWNRKGLWDTYPDWHIGRLQGSAVKHNPRACTVPDAAPGGDWQLEERDPVLFGPCDTGRRGTRDFSAMKSHIYRASMGYGKSGQAFSPFGRNGFRPRPADPSGGLCHKERGSPCDVLRQLAAAKDRISQYGRGRALVRPEGRYLYLPFFGYGLRLDRQLRYSGRHGGGYGGRQTDGGFPFPGCQAADARNGPWL